MTMTNEQRELVERLAASTNEEQIAEIREDISWSDSFMESVSDREVDFYLRRLLVASYLVDVNRKRKQAEKESRVKGQRNSIESYMTNLLAYTRKQLPDAVVSFESGSQVTKLEVLDKQLNLRLFFDKQRMVLNSVFSTRSYVRQVVTEDLSEWDAGVSGHGQSHRFVTFRREIEKEV